MTTLAHWATTRAWTLIPVAAAAFAWVGVATAMIYRQNRADDRREHPERYRPRHAHTSLASRALSRVAGLGTTLHTRLTASLTASAAQYVPPRLIAAEVHHDDAGEEWDEKTLASLFSPARQAAREADAALARLRAVPRVLPVARARVAAVVAAARRAEVAATSPWPHDTGWFTMPAIDADAAKAGEQ